MNVLCRVGGFYGFTQFVGEPHEALYTTEMAFSLELLRVRFMELHLLM